MPLRRDWEAQFAGPNNNDFITARFVCPHCALPSTFECLTLWAETLAGGRIRYYILLRCNYASCRKVVHVITTKAFGHAGQEPVTDELVLFPSRPPIDPHKAIPPAIGEDWAEAQRVYEIGAVKAAAVMCRRILYGILLDKKCKEHPLGEGIKQLVDKERLPGLIASWLSEIKEEGHDAAHPHRTLSVPAENVDEVMKYTGELLRILYVEPYELQERLTRKAAQAQPAQG